MITLKQFLAELTFIKIKEISRHSKGLLLALENSNRKEFLRYRIKPSTEETKIEVLKELHRLVINDYFKPYFTDRRIKKGDIQDFLECRIIELETDKSY